MIRATSNRETDYLPARMINEVVYCPRLFYYEHVEGVFAHNQETVEGSNLHSRVDAKEDEFPPADSLVDEEQAARNMRCRSVTLSSDAYGVIAKMDLVEIDSSEQGTARVVPVDYKRGGPCKADDGSITAWDPDRVQLGVQALILRDNGYLCDEVVVYYAKTRQRIRLSVDQELVDETLAAIDAARRTMAGAMPAPLIDSPKCPRCSLVGICLPDETNACAEAMPDDEPVQRFLFDMTEYGGAAVIDRPVDRPVRRLLPARDDQRPLYLNTQGLYVGKSGRVLKIKEKGKVVQEVRINEICQVNLMGNIQLTTQAIQALCQAEVPIAYFSMGGWFYGVTQGLGVKNIALRQEQFRMADVPSFCLRFARALVAGKIRNQRTLLQRNHVEPSRRALAHLKCMREDAEKAETLDQLLGIEGNAARIYFEHFGGMIKTGRNSVDDEVVDGVVGDGGEETSFEFDFARRNRRPPRDPVNALLSLAYSLLAKDLAVITQTIGLDPYLGFFHQPRFGRASLALDLMEPFRPLIADSAVLSAINTRMVTSRDFIRAGRAVALTDAGRKRFFRAYEQRMDSLVTHPLFGYRVSYRRVLEIQARLMARVLIGELGRYPVFTTR